VHVAEKIDPAGSDRGDLGGTHARFGHRGRWREPERRPTRAPHGDVLWWERPAPEHSDPQLWEAVQRIQTRRQQLGMSVTELARRLAGQGRAIRRETLSRVLNGKQPTTWDTAERLAHILGMEVTDLVTGDAPEQPPRP
jgi:ribosome-binding protein aMBF1 (putative translation factor)